ncbi:MAG: tRNA pseudouridine(38-40) synthase TruA [Lentisphaeria bacterium]|nr:tRNA pseudouridine(38-40) synthase TruA [Lentisphaeria bacterium]
MRSKMGDGRREWTPYPPGGRYLLEISYDGSEYCGYQVQPNGITVQSVLTEVLRKLYNVSEIHLVGSSRTDAGVHAQRFAVSFLYPLTPVIAPDKLQRALNGLLPDSIKIRSVREVEIRFHARYDAVGKAYTYVLNLGGISPFLNKYTYRPYQNLNVDAMRSAAGVLVGKHDFSSFTVDRDKIEDATRTIYSIDFQRIGDLLCITYTGDGFLYKMIRCLTGALEAVGRGRISREDLERILEAKNRSMAPETAPPQGLFLMKVFYDEAELQSYKLDGLPFGW